MNWRALPDGEGEEYRFQNTVLARLLCKEERAHRKPFRVTALLSILYAGTRAGRKLETQRREWLAWKRRFLTILERDRYLASKKKELEQRIRHKERNG